MATKEVATQTPSIPVADMIDPALDAGLKFAKADFAGLVEIQIMLEAAGEVYGVATLEPAVGGIDYKT